MEGLRSQWLKLLVVGGLGGILLGGILGYELANHLTGQKLREELKRVTHERDRYAIRERELQAQLQETLAAHATLAYQHERLQKDLTERISRLEAAVPAPSQPATPSP